MQRRSALLLSLTLFTFVSIAIHYSNPSQRKPSPNAASVALSDKRRANGIQTGQAATSNKSAAQNLSPLPPRSGKHGRGVGGEGGSEIDRLCKKWEELLAAQRYGEALALLKPALKRARVAHHAADELRLLLEIGMSYAYLLDNRAALNYYTKAEQLATKIYGTRGLLLTTTEKANIYTRIGEVQKALQHYDQAVRLSRQAGIRADDLLNLTGNLYLFIGDSESAWECHSRALHIRERTKDEYQIARSLHNLGNDRLEQGRYDEALALYEEALQRKRQAARGNDFDMFNIATTLDSIGGVYLALGQYTRARQYYEDSWKVIQNARITSTEMETASLNSLDHLARVYHKLGDLPRAREYNQRAITTFRTFVYELSELFLHRVELCRESGDFRGALEASERGRRAAGKLRNGHQRALLLTERGRTYAALDKPLRALRDYREALLELQRSGNELEITETRLSMAEAYEAIGEFQNAEAAYRKATASIESALTHIIEPSLTGEFLKTTGRVYARYADFLYRRKRYPESLMTAEQGRARGLAAQTALSRDNPLSLVSARDRAQWEKTLQNVRFASARLRLVQARETSAVGNASVEEQAKVAQEQYQTAVLENQTFATRMQQKYPRLRHRLPSPVPYTRLRQLARQHPDTLYIEWLAVDENRLLAYLLSADSGLKVKEVTVSVAELIQKKKAWLGLIQLEGEQSLLDPELEKKLAAELYRLILWPLEKTRLLNPRRFRNLVLVADGPLLDIPFSALQDAQDRRMLDKGFVLSTEYSLSECARKRKLRIPINSVLCIASPTTGSQPSLVASRGSLAPLPAAGKEADMYRRSLGADMCAGTEATRARVSLKMRNADLLCFPIHALLDPTDGLRSALVLSPKKTEEQYDCLEGREIAGMNLSRAQLAILSGCQTAQGQESGGEGLVGLAWAFRAAGCPSVVGSLWKVNDEATHLLMERLGREMRAGRRLDEALCLAMQEMKRRQGSPYFWAAFQVIGDTSPLHFAR